MLKFLTKLSGRVSSGQLVYFTRQLSIMLRAGLPLVRALHTLANQMSEPYFSSIVRSIALQVEQGEKLSDVMQRYPRIFPNYYVNMIKVAEIGGILDEIFHRLAVFLEKQERTNKKVFSALIYPAFILLVAFLIVFIIMTIVVPTFMKMFKEYDQALPLPTKILLSVSDFLRSKWWIGLLFVFCLWVVYKILLRFPRVRYKVDMLKLKIPLIGGLLKRFYISRFSQTLGTLLLSGVPVIDALEVVKGTVNNDVFKSIIQRLIFVVSEGEDLSSYLKAQPFIFPPLVVEMISIGEETGSLPDMLSKIAEIYDEEIDLMVSSFTSILEPFLIVSMGLIVGFIVISMFLPLFTLTQAMSQ